ncbi:MAG: type II toxin-antitoxin system prevent-host-death family antitoxin [Opitutaceae bacterium]|jgi:prevent-host-death family protein|nr:type II toxin-antitoxin system prevent-host-death family antitoxin [Opitutaceae bacterium]HRG54444.1 type II toxin-antitoxin system prevent-host-death family antitoxin [Lacunisphaera sp.]
MQTTTVRALRNDYAKLLRRVETGEEISISRRGRVVARLVPAHPGAGRVDWAASAAGRLPRTGRPLSATTSAKLQQASQGDW